MQKAEQPQSFEMTGVTLKTGEHSHPIAVKGACGEPSPFPTKAARGEPSIFIDSPPLRALDESLVSIPSVFNHVSDVKRVETTEEEPTLSRPRSSSMPNDGRVSDKPSATPLSEHRISIFSKPIHYLTPMHSNPPNSRVEKVKVQDTTWVSWKAQQGAVSAQHDQEQLISDTDFSGPPVKPPQSVTEYSVPNLVETDRNKSRRSSSNSVVNLQCFQHMDDRQYDKEHAAKAFIKHWERDEEILYIDPPVKERKASSGDVDRRRKISSSSDLVFRPREYPRVCVLYSFILFLIALIALGFLVIYSRERELRDLRENGSYPKRPWRLSNYEKNGEDIPRIISKRDKQNVEMLDQIEAWAI